jgi:hypothetical protein
MRVWTGGVVLRLKTGELVWAKAENGSQRIAEIIAALAQCLTEIGKNPPCELLEPNPTTETIPYFDKISTRKFNSNNDLYKVL